MKIAQSSRPLIRWRAHLPALEGSFRECWPPMLEAGSRPRYDFPASIELGM